MSLIKSIYRFVSPKFQTLFNEYKVDFKPRFGHGKPAHSGLKEIVNSHREEYRATLTVFLQFTGIFHKIKPVKNSADESEPYWNNGYLPGLDIVALYGFIAILKPKIYIEIGSGNSTMVARKAIRESQAATKIISIDPHPRASIDQLADTVIRKPLEDMTDYSVVDSLNENDILFIDNSHRCLPNSDVTVCFLEIIPRLKKGVIVHIHDIYIPYDYPQFMCDRFYSEQYLLATMLLSAPERYKTIMPNYFVSEDAELKKILEPIWDSANLQNVERHGGSYWFKIR